MSSVFFQDNNAETPAPEIAAEYAERVEMTRFPVLADIEGRLVESTPYDGLRAPRKVRPQSRDGDFRLCNRLCCRRVYFLADCRAQYRRIIYACHPP